MALNAALQRQVHLQRQKTLVFVERITRKVDKRWGGIGGMFEAAQAGDPVAAELVELVQRAVQRRRDACKRND